MYRQQLFKGGLTKSVIDGSGGGASDQNIGGGSAGGWTARLLSRSDLRALFTLGSTSRSDTMALLEELALPPPGSVSPAIDEHLRTLAEELGGPSRCCGVSHHDELFALSSEDGGLQAQLRKMRRTAAASAASATAAASDAAIPLSPCDVVTLKELQAGITTAEQVAPSVSTPTTAKREVRTSLLQPAARSTRRAALVVVDSSDSDGSDDDIALTQPSAMAPVFSPPHTSCTHLSRQSASRSGLADCPVPPRAVASAAAVASADKVASVCSPTASLPSRGQIAPVALFGHEACIDLSQSPAAADSADVTVSAEEPLASLPQRVEDSPALADTANDSIMDDLLCFFDAPSTAVTATQIQRGTLSAEAAAFTLRGSEDGTCGKDADMSFAPRQLVLAQAQASLQSRDVDQIRDSMASILGFLERRDEQPVSPQLAEGALGMSSALHVVAMELAAVLGWLPE